MTPMIPEDVRVMFAFIDIADAPAQLDLLICGWGNWWERDVCYVLGHKVIPGSVMDRAVWDQAAELLDMRWPHRIFAAMVDEGSGLHCKAARAFRRRMLQRGRLPDGQTTWRFMYTSKGVADQREYLKKSDNVQGLMTIGVSQIKAEIFLLLKTDAAKPEAQRSIRFSKDLPPAWYAELTNEHRVERPGRFGQDRVGYERISYTIRNEALDCLVGCFALRNYFGRILTPAWFARTEASLRKIPPPQGTPPLDGAGDVEEAPPRPLTPMAAAMRDHSGQVGENHYTPRPERSPQDDPSKALPPSAPPAVGSWFNRRPVR